VSDFAAVSSPAPLPRDLAEALASASTRLGVFASRQLYFPSVASTNDVADHLAAAGAAEGTTVIADAQTGGRGRLGRTWFSPPGAGLYVSVICRPEPQAESGGGDPDRARGPAVSLLTLAVGVALAESLRLSTGIPVALKWPNDLVVGSRKLGGILAEGVTCGSTPHYVVVGFGINLRAVGYPAEIVGRATSVEAELGKAVDRGGVLVEALARLALRYDDVRLGRRDTVLSRWRVLAPSSVGATVEWQAPGRVRRGITTGIDDEGALLVRADDVVERVVAGEVRWI
jgi:BirA family transcriptional regulator, biotin operon repressor / biotin---[acetyl-CoA-carboxylase] ligase